MEMTQNIHSLFYQVKQWICVLNVLIYLYVDKFSGGVFSLVK